MTDFTLYFGGAENATWRNTLFPVGAPMAASFWPMDVKSRGHGPRKGSLDFFHTARVLLDGGGRSATYKDERQQRRPLAGTALSDYADRFQTYVEDNAGDLAAVVEMDAPSMPDAERESRRREFYTHLRPGLFYPVWKGEGGLVGLRTLGARYGAVSVTSVMHQDNSLVPTLNSMARDGVLLHASGISDLEKLRQARFTCASSLTWTAPYRFGALHVWDGRKLQLFSRGERASGFARTRRFIEASGLDVTLIEQGDGTESVRLSLWSWMKWSQAFDQRTRTARPTANPFSVLELVPITDDDEEADDETRSDSSSTGLSEPALTGDKDPRDAHDDPAGVVIAFGDRRRERAMQQHPSSTGQQDEQDAEPPAPRELEIMPGFADLLPISDDGSTRIGLQVVSEQHRSARVCDSCYLAENCPKFRPGARCAFVLPVDVSSQAGARAVRDAMIAAQVERVSFALMNEQRTGVLDPNVRTEMGALWKQMQVKDEIDNPKLKVSSEISAPVGFLSQLLSGGPPVASREELPPPPIRILEQQE